MRTPTLMAFAVAARRLVAPALPGAPRPRPIEAALRDALLEMAGDGAVVILGREPGNIVWWELEQLARLTGWPLVGIDDLAERDGRVVLREDGSPVDVVWRRTNEDRLRGDDGRLTALGSLLLEPLRRGAVRVVNALRHRRRRRQAHVRLRRAARALLLRRGAAAALRAAHGTSPTTSSARRRSSASTSSSSSRATAPAARASCSARSASGDELSKLRAEIEDDPGAWIAQEPVALSTHPTVIDGRLEPRHVDLRPFVVGGRVLPGGLSRFAQGAGELVVNCAQGGGGKDVWVLPDPADYASLSQCRAAARSASQASAAIRRTISAAGSTSCTSPAVWPVNGVSWWGRRSRTESMI